MNNSHNMHSFTDVFEDELTQHSPPMSLSESESPRENRQIQDLQAQGPLPPKPAKYAGQYGEFRSIQEIDSKYRDIFSYPYFNLIQSRIMDDALYSDKSLVVCAPTGSGKTVVFELAIVQLLICLDERPDSSDFKIVYMAPVKALCAERLSEWYPKFTRLGLLCIELTGDTDVDFTQLAPYKIIITTPEKWDMLTRRWREFRDLVEQVRLFLIDEVHVLHDDTRGPVLEAVVSRMKTIEESMQAEHRIERARRRAQGSGRATTAEEAPRIRLVAVSATIGNPEDVAAWLSTPDRPAVFFKLGEECRPVRLRRVVEGYACPAGTPMFKFDMQLSYKLWPLIEKYYDGKPTLIFCSTRKSVTMTAGALGRELSVQLSAEQRGRLRELAAGLGDPKLRALAAAGVGCHHAGLLLHERLAVEHAFRRRDLPVLVTTTTLAMGVNLPAHLVIIKGTQQYVNGQFQEYPASTVLQMVGRAGRPQYDTHAVAVIMTRAQDKERYVSLAEGGGPLESALHRRLAEHLNSEVALRTVTDLAQGVQWARTTFLHVRAARDPRRYLGLPAAATPDQVSQKIQDMCVKAMNGLARAGLVTLDDACCVAPAPAGRLMSLYCLDFDTMKLIMQMSGRESLQQLLTGVVCESHELAGLQLRQDERRTLNSLNRSLAGGGATIRFPMKGKISTKQMKFNCMIQAVLGCLLIPDPSLQQEAMKLVRTAERICKCAAAYLTREEPAAAANSAAAAVSAVTLAKCCSARLWEVSPHVCRQLRGVGPALSAALVAAGKTTFALIEESHPRDLERIMNRNAPAGNVLRAQASLLPKYRVSVEAVAGAGEDEAGRVRVTLELLNAEHMAAHAARLPAGAQHRGCLLLGDCDNRLLLCASFRDSDLMFSTDGRLTFCASRRRAARTLHAHCISATFVGVDVETSLTLPELRTPSRATPPLVRWSHDAPRLTSRPSAAGGGPPQQHAFTPTPSDWSLGVAPQPSRLPSATSGEPPQQHGAALTAREWGLGVTPQPSRLPSVACEGPPQQHGDAPNPRDWGMYQQADTAPKLTRPMAVIDTYKERKKRKNTLEYAHDSLPEKKIRNSYQLEANTMSDDAQKSGSIFQHVDFKNSNSYDSKLANMPLNNKNFQSTHTLGLLDFVSKPMKEDPLLNNLLTTNEEQKLGSNTDDGDTDGSFDNIDTLLHEIENEMVNRKNMAERVLPTEVMQKSKPEKANELKIRARKITHIISNSDRNIDINETKSHTFENKTTKQSKMVSDIMNIEDPYSTRYSDCMFDAYTSSDEDPMLRPEKNIFNENIKAKLHDFLQNESCNTYSMQPLRLNIETLEDVSKTCAIRETNETKNSSRELEQNLSQKTMTDIWDTNKLITSTEAVYLPLSSNTSKILSYSASQHLSKSSNAIRGCDFHEMSVEATFNTDNKCCEHKKVIETNGDSATIKLHIMNLNHEDALNGQESDNSFAQKKLKSGFYFDKMLRTIKSFNILDGTANPLHSRQFTKNSIKMGDLNTFLSEKRDTNSRLTYTKRSFSRKNKVIEDLKTNDTRTCYANNVTSTICRETCCGAEGVFYSKQIVMGTDILGNEVSHSTGSEPRSQLETIESVSLKLKVETAVTESSADVTKEANLEQKTMSSFFLQKKNCSCSSEEKSKQKQDFIIKSTILHNYFFPKLHQTIFFSQNLLRKFGENDSIRILDKLIHSPTKKICTEQNNLKETVRNSDGTDCLVLSDMPTRQGVLLKNVVSGDANRIQDERECQEMKLAGVTGDCSPAHERARRNLRPEVEFRAPQSIATILEKYRYSLRQAKKCITFENHISNKCSSKETIKVQKKKRKLLEMTEMSNMNIARIIVGDEHGPSQNFREQNMMPPVPCDRRPASEYETFARRTGCSQDFQKIVEKPVLSPKSIVPDFHSDLDELMFNPKCLLASYQTDQDESVLPPPGFCDGDDIEAANDNQNKINQPYIHLLNKIATSGYQTTPNVTSVDTWFLPPAIAERSHKQEASSTSTGRQVSTEHTPCRANKLHPFRFTGKDKVKSNKNKT